jgi:NAD(P)-dependent dehydrogenase (short-subunit alcohol dehydrogenase family)
MALLEGKVVAITGAGRGIGRGEALLFARNGAKVVVNDLGAGPAGEGEARSEVAEKVVAEIRALGGEAVAHGEDISTMAGGESLIQTAVDRFGRLDILVNNAGILRDRMIFNMTELEWDAVVRVHLKGHFTTARAACAYWRDQHRAGQPVSGRIVNTTSPVALFGNGGQANYLAAKGGIVAFTMGVAMDMARYGVTCNCIAPGANTRLLNAVTGRTIEETPAEPETFDPLHPHNVAPLVVYLASDDAQWVSGQVFMVSGGDIHLARPWEIGGSARKAARWEVEELPAVVRRLFHTSPIGTTAVLQALGGIPADVQLGDARPRS